MEIVSTEAKEILKGLAKLNSNERIMITNFLAERLLNDNEALMGITNFGENSIMFGQGEFVEKIREVEEKHGDLLDVFEDLLEEEEEGIFGTFSEETKEKFEKIIPTELLEVAKKYSLLSSEEAMIFTHSCILHRFNIENSEVMLSDLNTSEGRNKILMLKNNDGIDVLEGFIEEHKENWAKKLKEILE